MVETMTVQSGALGAQEVPVTASFHLIEPLIGHQKAGSWVEIPSPHQANSPMSWIQSVEDPEQCFCVLDVFAAGLDLDLEVAPEQVAALQAANPEEIRVLAIVVLDADPQKIRANLRAPILLAPAQQKAKQIVLHDESLPVQWFLAGPPPQVNLSACSS